MTPAERLRKKANMTPVERLQATRDAELEYRRQESPGAYTKSELPKTTTYSIDPFVGNSDWQKAERKKTDIMSKVGSLQRNVNDLNNFMRSYVPGKTSTGWYRSLNQRNNRDIDSILGELDSTPFSNEEKRELRKALESWRQFGTDISGALSVRSLYDYDKEIESLGGGNLDDLYTQRDDAYLRYTTAESNLNGSLRGHAGGDIAALQSEYDSAKTAYDDILRQIATTEANIGKLKNDRKIATAYNDLEKLSGVELQYLDMLNEDYRTPGDYLDDNIGNQYIDQSYAYSQQLAEDRRTAEKGLRDLGYTDAQIKALTEQRSLTRDYEATLKAQEDAAKLAQDKPGWASAASVLMSPFKVLGTAYSTGQRLMGEEINPYSDWFYATHANEAIRGTVRSEYADDWFKGAQLPDWFGGKQYAYDESTGEYKEAEKGTWGAFLYDTAMSMADNVLNMALSVGYGKARGLTGKELNTAVSRATSFIMSSEVASDAVVRGLEKGYSSEKAYTLGIVEGAIEYITEKVSLDKILNGSAGFLRTLGRSFLIEGTEEYAAGWLNRVLDLAANSDRSEMVQLYERFKEQGMSDTSAYAEAFLALLGEDAQTFVSGGLAGLGFGGVTSVRGAVQNRQIGSAYGRAAAEYKRLGEMLPEKSYAHKLAAKIDLESASDERIGRMITAVAEEQTKAVEERLKELHQGENVSEIAEALVQQAVGFRLTEQQQALLRNNSRAAQVARELDGIAVDEIPTGAEVKPGVKTLSITDYSKKYGDQEQAMIHTYNMSGENRDLARFDAAYGEAYKMGRDGFNKDYVHKSILTSYLTPDQREVAYEAGKASVSSPEIISALKELKVETGAAEKLAKEYRSERGIKSGEYAAGAAAVYNLGRYSIPVDEAASVASILTKKQVETAYDAGVEQAKQDDANAKKDIVKTVSTDHIGKVHFGYGLQPSETGDTDILAASTVKQTQRAGIRAARMIAALTGTDIYVYESYVRDGNRYYKDESGQERIAENGFYNPKDGTIHLDLNAGAINDNLETRGTILFTLAHELVHKIRANSPEQFRKLSAFLFEQYAAKGQSVSELIAKKQEDYGYDYDTAYEEVVADSMESILSSGNVIKKLEELKRRDAKLWEKMANIFRDFVARLRNIVKSYANVTPDSREGKLVQQMQDIIPQLEKLYAEALYDASKQVSVNSNASYSGNGNKLSKRVIKVDTAKEMQYWGLQRIGDYQYVQKTIINKLTADGFFDSNGQRIVKNVESGMNVVINRRGIQETFGPEKRYAYHANGVKIKKIATIRILPDVIEHGTLLENKKPNDHNVNSGVKYAYIQYPVEIDGVQNYVVADIRISRQKNLFWIHGVFINEKNRSLTANASEDGNAFQSEAILEPILPPLSNEVNTRTGENSNLQKKINSAMTMEQAKRMLESTFRVSEIARFSDGEYKTAEQWLRDAGADEVAMYIENDFDLQKKYIDANEDILNEEYTIADVLEAYSAGTLVGKVKAKPVRLDTSVSTRLNDTRFYSPQQISDAQELYQTALKRASGADASSVYQARAKILLFAHNKGAAELLGITQAELNKKLRAWSRYSATALKVSQAINKGVAEENRWTGIENCSYISRARVSEEDVERLVKSVKGDPNGFERRYIARVMLAADTHIDYSGLEFEFMTQPEVAKAHGSNNRVRGFFDGDSKIVATLSSPETVAHEMGHYIDSKWGRDLIGKSGHGLYLTRSINKDMVRQRYGEAGIQFINNFNLFMDSLTDSNNNSSSYTNDRAEVFARFFAKFVEWTDNIATGNNSYRYESASYNDKFTQAQYVEFARLLQEKALLDGTATETDEKKYSKRPVRNSEGTDLTSDQQAYFSESQAVDKNGNLAVLWHGTENGGFTEFDPQMSDDHISLFLTDNINLAYTYSGSTDRVQIPKGKPKILRWTEGDATQPTGQRGVYKVYANITNPLVIDAKGTNWNRLSEGAFDTLSFHVTEGSWTDVDSYDPSDPPLKLETTTNGRKRSRTFDNASALRQFLRSQYDGSVASKIMLSVTKGQQNGDVDVTYDTNWDTEAKTETIDRTTRDIARKAYEDGYTGVIFRNVMDSGKYGKGEKAEMGTVYIVFDSNNIKDVDNLHPTKSRDIRYQQRPTESVSNRALLSGALAELAQNDDERRRIAEYQKNVDQLNEQEAKLRDLNAQIKEMSFAKGERGTEYKEKMRELRDEATKTANRINVYDKRLLNLESTAILKNVLKRESAKALNRAKQRGAEALQKQREQSREKTAETVSKLREEKREAVKKERDKSREKISDLKAENRSKLKELRDEKNKKIEQIQQDNRDARKRDQDKRSRTQMRHKIINVVNDLNQYLLKGNKTKHVPIELQKPVADALSIINMDTYGADDRLKKYDEMIASTNDPQIIAELTASRNRIAETGGKIKEKLDALKTAYDKILESNDPLMINGYDDVVSRTIANVAQTVGDTRIRDMSYEQLESVYKMYKMLLTRVREANKAFAQAKTDSVSELSAIVAREVKEVGGVKEYSAKALDGIRKFSWNNLKPIYAFERIGSETFTELYNNVRKGEDVWARDVYEAQQFFGNIYKKLNKKDLKNRFPFTSTDGVKFELGVEQIMSLYAYSKRAKAKKHLEIGGFVYDSAISVKKRKGGILDYTVNVANPIRLDKALLDEISGKLTEEQRDFVDAAQRYLSDTMGAKGNEVSRAMYGIDLFKEENYFPLKSSMLFLYEHSGETGEPSIKGSGFTKETNPNADNPIILSDFTSVWGKHVNDMSMYHAFVLPLEDFNRVFQSNLDSGPVKAAIHNAYGDAANKYVKQLIQDINGGVRSDPRESAAKKLIGLQKKAAVLASASVVIQQPSAIARALSEINARYFDYQPKIINHKRLWTELKQYAPVAIIKEMGRFDTDVGVSTVDYIIGKKKFRDKVDDVVGRAPALMDELTWVHIWTAVKRETLAKIKKENGGKSVDVKSDEFLQRCGERFTEVITKTQVYDSVFSRSANMRAKGAFMSMLTSFMAEPTTTANMVVNAFRQAARGNKKFAARTIGSAFASVVLNSALVSLVYGLRDDDEDETYWEKYLGAFTAEMIDGVNPLTYLPITRDIMSLFEGYDVERADMSIISDVVSHVSSFTKLLATDTDDMDEDRYAEHKRKIRDAIAELTTSVMAMGGIPAKNMMRYVTSIQNAFAMSQRDLVANKASTLDAIKEAAIGKTPILAWLPQDSATDKLYTAIITGDTAYQERLESSYEDQRAIDTARRKGLRENDPRIKLAAVEYFSGNLAEYADIADEIIKEGDFTQDDVVTAVTYYVNKMEPDEDDEYAPKAKSLFETEDFFTALGMGDKTLANRVRDEIIRIDVMNGDTQEEAEEDFRSDVKSTAKKMYLDDAITQSMAQNILTEYAPDDGIQQTLTEWEFKRTHPSLDWSAGDITAYTKPVEVVGVSAKDSGISTDVFEEYRARLPECKGTDSDGDGTADKGTAKAEKMALIDSLPITDQQKTVLYFENGWAESTLDEAPWF